MSPNSTDPISPFETNDPSDEAEYDKWAQERGLEGLDDRIREQIGWPIGGTNLG